MPKNLMLEVLNSEHLPGLRALRPVKKLKLAPGRYQVCVVRWGVGEPAIFGSSDRLSFGLKVGADTVVAASGTIVNARRVNLRISSEPQVMTLGAGDELGLAVALVQDRGKKPAALKLIVDEVLGKLPDADAKTLAELALSSGINAAFGVALASALFVKLANSVINSLFGKHPLVKVSKRVVQGVPGETDRGTICFAQLPNFDSINVDDPPKYTTDFGVRADDYILYETIRDHSGAHESHSFPRWTRSSETYVVVDFERIG